MDEETRFTQEDIKASQRDRARGEYGGNAEPLYGLEPIAGGHGEAPIEESAAEEAEEEAGRPGEPEGYNLTWGIIFGGVLTLFIVATILILFVGPTYSANVVTNYPIK
jgi:hypothetical protein